MDATDTATVWDVYDKAISAANDDYWTGNGTEVHNAADNSRTYTFSKDTEIDGKVAPPTTPRDQNVSGTNAIVKFNSKETGKVTLDMQGHDLFLNAGDTINAGLYFTVDPKDKHLDVDINNPGSITLQGKYVTASQNAYDPSRANTAIVLSGDTALTVKGDKAQLNVTSSGGNGSGNQGGLLLWGTQRGALKVEGDLNASGFQDAFNLHAEKISIGGGKIIASRNLIFFRNGGTDDRDVGLASVGYDETGHWRSFYSKDIFSQVDFNVVKDAKENVTGAGSHELQLEGNIVKFAPASFGGEVNIGLATPTSYWKGAAPHKLVIDDYGDVFVNLYMNNGASWTNTGDSTINSIHASNGNIYMQDGSAADIGTFSGHANVYYNLDKTTPTQLAGGDFKIEKADSGSSYTVIADASGAGLAQTDYRGLLKNIAYKLYYMGGDTNLSATVKVEEGLTSAGLTSAVVFDPVSKQGYIQQYAQTTNSFTDPITGSFARDTAYVNGNVLDPGGHVYDFLKNSTISTKDKTVSGGTSAGQIGTAVAGVNGTSTLTLHNHDLTAKAEASGNAAGIAAVGSGKVEIQDPGALDISASSTGGEASALYVNDGGQIAVHNGTADETKVLKLSAAADSKDKGAVVRALNNGGSTRSQITVDGLVDVTADGKGADTAVLSEGSTVTLGGGTISAENGTAVKAYGDGTNTGTVNINVNTNARGAATAAKTAKTQITGDIRTASGSNTAGVVNIGLSGEDSFLKGNYTSAVSGEVAQKQVVDTGLNLFLSNKADWTGDTAGTTYLNMTGDATWHGTNTSDQMSINMTGNATWFNTGSSSLKYLNAPVNSVFSYTNGTIDMTDDHAGDVTIDNYSGRTFVEYKHEGDQIPGGRIIVKHADRNSAITLSTDYTGITKYNENSVLEALAKKLIYKGYVGKAEDNLHGYVQIAEGLTSSSKVMSIGTLAFSDVDGTATVAADTIKSRIALPTEDTNHDFVTPITGNAERDTEYTDKGVLDASTGVYNFTEKENTVTAANTVAGGAWLNDISSAIFASSSTPTTINANRNTLNVNNTNLNGMSTGISATQPSRKVIINNAGNMKITVRGTDNTAGLYTNSGGSIYIDNDGTDENGNPYVLTIDSATTKAASGIGIKTMNGMGGMESAITVTGLVDITTDTTPDKKGYLSGFAISAVASTINVGGGNIVGLNHAGAIQAYGEFVSENTGKVNVNILHDADGNIIGAGNHKTTIKGDFLTIGGMGSKGQINVGLNGKDSYWEGNYNLTSAGILPNGLGSVNLYAKNGAHWKGWANGSITLDMDGAGTYWYGFLTDENRNAPENRNASTETANAISTTEAEPLDSRYTINSRITLKNGATWYNALSADQTRWDGKQVDDKVGELVSDGGVIDMTGRKLFTVPAKAVGDSSAGDTDALTEVENGVSGNIVVGSYQGDATVLYRRDTAAPTDVLGGTITINKAAEGSKIDLVTDSEGIDTSNETTLETTLKNLARKLIYTETVTADDGTNTAAHNLSGQVKIAEGLTSSSAALNTADLRFDENGQGDFDPNTVVSLDSTIYYGPKETAMMRGAKSAMASTAMLWRATNNDIQKRLGDLRLAGADTDDGVWAKVGRGRMSYDQDNTNFRTTFTDYYAGYDKKVGHSNWRLGAAFSYLDGKSHYEHGHSDNDAYAIYVYGTQMRPDNSYIDIVGRVGHVKNDYRVYNDYGHKLDGDYSTNGFSLSAEYGKRFESDSGFYVEPQAEVIWSKLASKDYSAKSDYNGGDTMDINQHTYDSFIGRLGLGIGVKKDRFSAYAKASLLHEFSGGFDTDYTAQNYETQKTHLDFGGTWLAMDLGGTFNINDRTSLYGYFERTFNNDVRTDWRYNVGLRFSF